MSDRKPFTITLGPHEYGNRGRARNDAPDWRALRKGRALHAALPAIGLVFVILVARLFGG